MPVNDTTIDVLNGLLRGELAAMETYQQALEKLAGEPASRELVRIHRNHQEAASTLREHIYRFGGRPEHASGGWGSFAQATEALAMLVGPSVALKALRDGEAFAARSYADALQDRDLPAECKDLIRSSLLPQTQQHILDLHCLMNSQ
jgi:uncharacterized protein (TIGR02284 family)